MGKLYYITGSSEEVRKQVYGEILQWSRTQQIQPLQPWSAEQPNFYLYNYLAHGNQETLIELTETYGEEAVESIYLKGAMETEAALLQKGVYKSYDPHTNLPQCLQEIVETVFTGYKAVQYDFAAAVQQKMQALYNQQNQYNTNAQPQTKSKLQESIKAVVGRIPKKLLLRALVLTAWFVIVCVLTATIYNAVNDSSIEKGNGALIQVSTPSEEERAEPLPILSESASELVTEIQVGEMEFQYHKVGYSLEIIPELYRNGKKYCCISYGTNSGEPYYIPCKATPFYQKSNDNQVATIWIDGTLWLADEDGIRPIQEDVASFALAYGNGNSVFFISGDTLYCYDKDGASYPQEVGKLPEEEIKQGLMLRAEVSSLIINWDGSYCAYNCTNGTVVIIHKETLAATYLYGTDFDTLVALSNDGKWVYGNVDEDGVERIARIQVKNGIVQEGQITLLGNADKPCYFNEDATEVLYQLREYNTEEGCEEEALYYCDADNSVLTKVASLDYSYWKPVVSTADGMQYGEHYFSSGLAEKTFDLIYMDGTVYQLAYHNPGNIGLEEYQSEESVIITSYKEDDATTVWGYSSFNELFYQDKQNRLHCWTASGEDAYVMDCANVKSYQFAKNGDLFYVTEEGILGWIQAAWETHGEVEELYDFSKIMVGNISFTGNLGDSTVYLYVETRDATDIYRISEEECVYLGGII